MVKETREEKIDKLIELVELTLIEKKEDKTYRETHAEEHRFLRQLISKSEADAELKRIVSTRIISGGIWALIVGLGSLIWFSLKTYLKS